MALKKYVVTQDPEKPIATEIIAQSIKDISDGMKKIREGRLNEKALVLLLSETSGVRRTDVSKVLLALDHLETIYLKKAGR